MKWYVYHLIDPRSESVFYVGKGSGDRIEHHEREALTDSTHPKCDVIRSIWAEGNKVRRLIVKHFNQEAEAYAFEEQEVDRIGLEALTNLVRGGGVPRDRRYIPIGKYEMSEHDARQIVKSAADALRKFAAGRIPPQWHEMLQKMLSQSFTAIRDKFGIGFIRDELKQYNIKAEFA
jgi:hypothetical protein